MINTEEIKIVLNSQPFTEIDRSFFPQSRSLEDILQKECRIRKYQKGDIVIREGDFGTSAFVIIQGSVYYMLDKLPDKFLGRQAKKNKKSAYSFFKDLLKPPLAEEYRENIVVENDLGKRSEPQIFINKVDTVLSNLRKTLLEKGEIFGEISAYGRDPRPATVVANENTILVEIFWQGVRDLRKYSPEIRELFDSFYRSRSLEKNIRRNKLFANLNDAELSIIMKEAILETEGDFEHDEAVAESEKLIIEQGDYINGLIIIRSGFAKVTGINGQTIRYLSRGDHFGLDELAHNWRTKQRLSYQNSLTVLGYLDTIVIPSQIIEEIVLPKLDEKSLPQLINKTDKTLSVDPYLLDFMVSNRFNNGRSIMMIDLERCTRCNDCVQACSDTHQNNPRFVRDGKQFGNFLVANSCMHCSDPFCMDSCPTGAIYREETTGEIVINEASCIGCANCEESCIYNNIKMVQIKDKDKSFYLDSTTGKPMIKVTKCDLCIESKSGPACEKSCPTDALKRVDLSDFKSFVKWAEES